MSIIAYDGRYIAADRQSTQYDMSRPTTKLFLHGACVLGVVGDYALALLLRQWFAQGANEDKWPEAATKDDGVNTCLVVANRQGLGTYREHPILVPLETEHWAFGCGAEIAMGAMGMGADARQAVEVASKYSVFCGEGMDWYDLQALPEPGGPEDRVRKAAARRTRKQK